MLSLCQHSMSINSLWKLQWPCSHPMYRNDRTMRATRWTCWSQSVHGTSSRQGCISLPIVCFSALVTQCQSSSLKPPNSHRFKRQYSSKRSKHCYRDDLKRHGKNGHWDWTELIRPLWDKSRFTLPLMCGRAKVQFQIFFLTHPKQVSFQVVHTR